MASTRKIYDGPSKFDFMNALFDGKEVQFTIEGIGAERVEICRVAIEDGSRQRWLFEFRLAKLVEHHLCKGYYDTRTRTGWVESSGQSVLSDSGLGQIIDRLVGK